ncbi:MAG: putative kinase [Candidatus Saccharibacteria bacterium]|nr:putative kinase [Candidatus Saccharibacteria bacterium]
MKAIIGIGIPGSGKTTLLRPLAREQGLAYVNRDDIREEITGDPTNHTKEPAVNRLMYQRIQEALKHKGVVVDATHSKVRDRKEIVRFSREHGAREVIGYWVRPPLEIAQQRNMGRPRQVREEVLQTMANRLKLNPPVLDEGFDEIIEVT